MALEIEVKFYLNPAGAVREEIRRRIGDMDGRSDGRVFEKNIRFEDAGGSLLKRRALLRLRQDRRVRLTFKSQPADVSKRERERFKIFEELEVEVSDMETMIGILGAIGFHPVQVYEKWRETFRVGQSQICLDTMPFGDFVEIEGPAADIPGLAQAMGLDWERRILENYLGIFAHLKRAASLPFTDITFDHFGNLTGQGAPGGLASLIQSFEGGGGQMTPA